MTNKLYLLVPTLMLLAGCDAATEFAGDTLEGEVRRGVIAQCEQLAEGAGVAASRVSSVCQCSGDKFVADKDLTLSDISRERLEGIIKACLAETDPDGVGR